MESVILTITTICCLIRLLQLAMYGMTVANSDVRQQLDNKCSKLTLKLTIKSVLLQP